jgi:hypothetical protein
MGVSSDERVGRPYSACFARNLLTRRAGLSVPTISRGLKRGISAAEPAEQEQSARPSEKLHMTWRLPPVRAGGNLISVVRGSENLHGTASQSPLDAHRRGPFGSLAHPVRPSATRYTAVFPSGMEHGQHRACAAFFAVSMTDERHSEIVAFEECSTSKRELVCSPGDHALPQSGTELHTPPQGSLAV